MIIPIQDFSVLIFPVFVMAGEPAAKRACFDLSSKEKQQLYADFFGVQQALEGDFDSAEWVIVHDIIGHSISSGGIGGGYYWDTIAEYIHDVLPAHLRLGGLGDQLPDVLGAIFTGQVDRDDVDEAVQKYVMELRRWDPGVPEEHKKIREKVRDIVERIFEHIEYWKNSIVPGKPELINPF